VRVANNTLCISKHLATYAKSVTKHIASHAVINLRQNKRLRRKPVLTDDP